MEIIQWIVAAGTTLFVALVGFFQWRTTQHRAVLDLFDRRHEIFEIIRQSVAKLRSNSSEFDSTKEQDFLAAKERAYFFFGDDIQNYLEQMWLDIVDVTSADSELKSVENTDERREIVARRRKALNNIGKFYIEGQAMFAKYMRFAQTVPRNIRLG